MRRRISGQDCPIVLSITETTAVTETDGATVIQRNQVRESEVRESNDIYVHAREIYLRARRQRMARAASIF
jgi:ABC-type transporter lipoprotein component MlaA